MGRIIERMGIILPVASGKGGVGKSVFAVNLAVALAELGKTTVLIDLDLGGANLHTLLGIKNRHNGIGGLVYKTESGMEALLVETDVPRLFFIPGDTLLPGTANLDFFTKQKIIRGIQALPADYVILDLGAGSAYNTVDFFLTASSGVVVTIPEITAVLNAYSFLKTTLFRMLFRSYPPKGPERKAILEFVSKKIEGTEESFPVLQERLGRMFPESSAQSLSQVQSLFPRIVLNMGSSNKDLSVGARLRDITLRNLGIPIEYIGFIPRDEAVPKSVVSRRPVLLSYPGSAYAMTLRAVARRLLETPIPAAPRLYQDHEDLIGVAEEGLGAAGSMDDSEDRE